MSGISDIVASNIRELRRARKWPQRTLAERCAAHGGEELNRAAIAAIEIGRRGSISVDALVVFAAVFDVRPEELLTPFECLRCHGAPPEGFTCKQCGNDG